MKKHFLKALVLPLLAFSGVSSSAEQGWITTAKVVRIVATSNGGINVRLSPELSGCVSQSGYGAAYASVYPDHPGKDKITSILLSAYLADKTVAVYLTDNTCRISEVELGGR